MDIRKFFSPSGNKKKQPSDDEEDFVKPKKKLNKRKGVLFDSDSSDEEPIPKTVRQKLNASSPAGAKSKVKAEKASKPKLQETSPSAFFGNFKPSSSNKPVVKRKTKDDTKATKTKILKKEIDENVVIIDEDDSDTNIFVQEKENTTASKRKGKSESKKRKSSESSSPKKAPVTKKEKEPKHAEEKEKKKSKNANQTPKKASKKLKTEGSNKSQTDAKQKTEKTPDKTSKQTGDQKDKSSDKQARYLQFQHWQNRSGPSAPGSKEVPQGNNFCFEGMIFVITGVQESLTRVEIKSLIEQYGGKVTTSVSSRTTYLITGSEAGESKLKKASQHRTTVIDEDQFLDLLRTLPGKRSKYEIAAEAEAKKDKQQKRNKSESLKKENPSKHTTKTEVSPEKKARAKSASTSSPEPVKSSDANTINDALMWVDKYKPKTIKQIIGQQGPSSNVNKLLNWLRNWHANNRTAEGKARPKPKITPWGGGDPTGASFKAALLSGPPGVGKTTSATLVCKELGLPFVELNASDQRSKKSLKEDVAASVHNTSLSNLFGAGHNALKSGGDHVLIMDEVDGMAGNEDRGGMQELIQIIKTTKIPIICMCNDRSSPKMRSLANYCFDLRFQRPRVEHILSSVMSICYKEGFNVQSPAVQAIIRGCNQDVRQVLHNLNMLKASNTSLSYDSAKSHANRAHKDIDLGIFEIARKLLSESGSLSLLDKSDLFFMDYSMIPKFIQENYMNITPFSAQGNTLKHLQIVSKTADSIASGDMIEATMMRDQNWSLLPTLGLLSTVIPCDYMRGKMNEKINFPSFFGKLSSTGKNRRLLQELKFHSSLGTCGSTESTMNLDMMPYLRWHLTYPLLQQSSSGEVEVPKVTKLLGDYDLTRDDFDSLIEVGQFQGRPNYMSQVESKVKAAFTRTYNKESHLTPYAVESAAAKKKKKAAAIDPSIEDAVEDEESDDGDDMGVDGMIKQSKKSSTSPVQKSRGKKSKTSGAGASTSRKKRK